MCGASRTPPAAEALVPPGGQRHRIEFEGLMRLFEGKQAAAVPEHARVGRAAVAALRQRVAGGGIAEGAEERAAGFMFQFPFRRARPAVAVRHLAATDVESVHHAVAGKPVVAVVARRVLRVRANAVQAARQARRQRAFEVQRLDVMFFGKRSVVAAEEMGIRLW